MKGKHHSKETKTSISLAQKGRKHLKQEGFKKGHKVFGGIKTRFIKGQIGFNKGKKCPWAYKHGMNGTSFYSRWRAILQRCNNKKHKQYKDYGARGIKNEWISFEEFKKDMYDSFQSHIEKNGESQTRIERIDNNGNYNKQNCRWATCKEQMRNTRNNHMITYKGKTQCMTDWAKDLGISYSALWKRLKKTTIDQALSGYEV